ncbi:MAG: hypothetical protein ABIY70_05625 [Capsulimonas sp.]|jgi:hypothetical protein|uniref:hypothetical protein n=1 Tax=Capsulimonas sp. TaxID=2494211 RepID=UPI0032674C26
MAKLNEADDPAQFALLSPEEKTILMDWIKSWFEASKTEYKHNSFVLKNYFEEGATAAEKGFYINNGAFKGAMIKCGFRPIDANLKNWSFEVKVIRPCPRTLVTKNKDGSLKQCPRAADFKTGECSFHAARSV